MKILFSNGNTTNLGILNTPLGDVYRRIYKNLCQVDLQFRDWDNPYYLDRLTYDQLVDQLVFYAKQVLVEIDRTRCLAQDQIYFNEIHKIYELNYHGQSEWLDFHEHIHLCEYYAQRLPKVLDIDYREKAGILERPFKLEWLADSTTEIKTGDVFVSWAELGKTPYTYWSNNEPNDVDRLCKLAKPWLKLRPKILIALEDIDTLKNKKKSEFEKWWAQYHPIWCRYWNLESWTIKDMYSVTVIGKVDDVELIKTQLKNNINPIKILK